MGRRQTSDPRDHVIGGAWPQAVLDGAVEALYAQALALRLHAAIGDRSVRSIARDAGLSHTALQGILAGASYADLRTIALLEHAVGQPLLPDWEERSG